MSLSYSVSITCDNPSCGATQSATRGDQSSPELTSKQSSELIKNGWHFQDGKTFCRACKPDERWPKDVYPKGSLIYDSIGKAALLVLFLAQTGCKSERGPVATVGSIIFLSQLALLILLLVINNKQKSK